MKTFKQFISELTQADLDAESSSINQASQRIKKTTQVNKPDFGRSQSEPQAPTNIAPAVASAANQATGRYAGHLLGTVKKFTGDAVQKVARAALGAK